MINTSQYRDPHGVVHVVECRKLGEWNFSDGPPSDRGTSADYYDLQEGLRDFAGETLVFHLDENVPPEGGYQFSVRLHYDTRAANTSEALKLALDAARQGHVYATVSDARGVLVEADPGDPRYGV